MPSEEEKVEKGTITNLRMNLHYSLYRIVVKMSRIELAIRSIKIKIINNKINMHLFRDRGKVHAATVEAKELYAFNGII